MRPFESSSPSDKTIPRVAHPEPTPNLSVIIPTLNEEKDLERTIRGLRTNCLLTGPRFQPELIIVDGGSSDATLHLGRELGCRIFRSQPGRAIQMNLGAQRAKGEHLLFLHADTLLPPGWDLMVIAALGKAGVNGGAFSFKLDNGTWPLNWIETMTNLRSRILLDPYGDQALFCRRSTFDRIGGFQKLPLMEDVAFVSALKKEGRLLILKAPVTTSARRWRKAGLPRTTLDHYLVRWGFRLGICPEKLAKWRYREGPSKGNPSPKTTTSLEPNSTKQEVSHGTQ